MYGSISKAIFVPSKLLNEEIGSLTVPKDDQRAAPIAEITKI